MKKRISSSILLLCSSFIWASAFIPTRYLGNIGFGVFAEIFVRYMVPVLILGIFYSTTISKASLSNILRSAITGLFLWLALVLAIYGIRTIEYASVGLILITLYVLFIPLVTTLFYKKRIAPTLVLSAMLSFIGIAVLLIGKPLGTPNIGTALCILASLFYTTYLLLCNTIVHSSISPQVLHFYQSITAILLSIPFICYFDTPQTLHAIAIHSSTYSLWLALAFTGLCSGFLAYQFLFYAQIHLLPTAVAVILSTKNIFGAILDVAIFNAPLTSLHYVAYILVISATILASVYSYKK